MSRRIVQDLDSRMDEKERSKESVRDAMPLASQERKLRFLFWVVLSPYSRNAHRWCAVIGKP